MTTTWLRVHDAYRRFAVLVVALTVLIVFRGTSIPLISTNVGTDTRVGNAIPAMVCGLVAGCNRSGLWWIDTLAASSFRLIRCSWSLALSITGVAISFAAGQHHDLGQLTVSLTAMGLAMLTATLISSTLAMLPPLLGTLASMLFYDEHQPQTWCSLFLPATPRPALTLLASAITLTGWLAAGLTTRHGPMET